MKHSTPRPCVADLERFAKLYALGCIISKLYHNRWEPAEIHHLVEGYRLGHQFTIPLSSWFHRGVPPDWDMSISECAEKFGPSLALTKKKFVAKYGTERELLAKTNELIAELPDV